MRTTNAVGTLSAQAIAGTQVVSLGWDTDRNEMAGTLGFGTERVDHTAS